MKKVLLLVNGKASQAGETQREAAEFLRAEGLQVETGETSSPDDYARLILQHQKSIDGVVLGGGDGTLKCAAEVLMQTKIPLGILPLGTANNVARSLGLPLELREACRVVAQGKTAPMDLARVNGELFVSVVGMGFSTQVHKQVPDEHKKSWGSLSYAFQALRLLRGNKKGFRAEVRFDNSHVRVKALQITVCNGKYYGAHVQVHPDATLDDALLHLSIIESKSYLKGFLKALSPWHTQPSSEGLHLFRSKKFEVHTTPSISLDVEGSNSETRTPARFEVCPNALLVRVPL